MSYKTFNYSIPYGFCRIDKPFRHKNTKHGPNKEQCCPKTASSTAQLIESQLEKAREYRNRHVTVEIYRRDMYYEILRECYPDLAAMQKKADRLQKEVGIIKTNLKKNNAESRKKLVCDEDDNVEIKTKKKEYKSLYKTVKSTIAKRAKPPQNVIDARDDWKKIVKKYGIAKRTIGSPNKMAEKPPHILEPFNKMRYLEKEWRSSYPFASKNYDLDEKIKTIHKRMYNTSGLGSYTTIAIDEEAKKLSKGPPPKYYEYDGTGYISVDLDATVDDIINCDRKPIAITLLRKRGNGTKRLSRDLMNCCMVYNEPTGDEKNGKQKRRNCIIDIPFFMHRPLPIGGSVKRVKLVRSRTGYKYDWNLQFIVSVPDNYTTAPEYGDVGVVLCQSKLYDGLLVAVAVGDDGAERRLILKNNLINMWTYVDKLQQKRDELHISLVRVIKDYINNDCYGITPDWMVEYVENIDKRWWRYKHLRELCNAWSLHNSDYSVAYKTLEEFMKRDLNLFNEKCAVRKKAERKRLDIYRKFAVKLTLGGNGDGYRNVYLPDTDYAAMRKKPDVTEEDKYRKWSEYKNIASLGLLRECLAYAAHYSEKKSINRKCPSCQTNNTDNKCVGNIIICKWCKKPYNMYTAAAKSLLM